MRVVTRQQLAEGYMALTAPLVWKYDDTAYVTYETRTYTLVAELEDGNYVVEDE